MTAAPAATTAVVPSEGVVLGALRARPRLWALLAVVVVWVAIWSVTEGTHTLHIPQSARTDAHRWLQDLSDSVSAAFANESNVIVAAINSFADAMQSAFTWLQH